MFHDVETKSNGNATMWKVLKKPFKMWKLNLKTFTFKNPHSRFYA